MSEYDNFEIDLFESIEEEPKAMKLNNSNDYTDRMEHCALKSKGSVKPEDLLVLSVSRSTSKSMPIFDCQNGKKQMPNDSHKSILHHNSEIMHVSLFDQTCKVSCSKIELRSVDRFFPDKEIKEVRRPRKISMQHEIRIMLNQLSKMHSKSYADEHTMHERMIEEHKNFDSKKEIELIDQDYQVTMKDVMPAL
eukprot:CAMPEP_0168334968 /NCGR_PEP_ID=MMETSP0213-20121227/10614_1 /TAXON_ID=151035 /ORGANISM="Euplotes harpa, Strain FSP1.4" /LENGTH=192 /DNA_ID=CAMNT_0008339775 /DNA_START=24 /DNA_END=602 /DNA_ORIENTATION=-